MVPEFKFFKHPPTLMQIDPGGKTFKYLLDRAAAFDRGLPTNVWNPFSEHFGCNSRCWLGSIRTDQPNCSWQAALVSSSGRFWPTHYIFCLAHLNASSCFMPLHSAHIRIFNHEGAPCFLPMPDSYQVDWLQVNTTVVVEELALEET